MRPALTLVVVVLGLMALRASGSPVSAQPLIELTVAHDGSDPKRPWSDSHLGFCPAGAGDQGGLAVITTQRMVLADSDNYLGISAMESRDEGRTWTEPVEQPTLRRQRRPNGIERSLCDFALQGSAATGQLLGIGGLVDYRGAEQVQVEPGYAVFDRKADAWGAMHPLVLPDPQRFQTAIAGNAQWVEAGKGDILLPIYYQHRPASELTANDCYSSVVLRCHFDGEHLRVGELGSGLTVPFGRGLYEPGLMRCGGHYYLTMRNDLRGYVTVSDDGLNFPTPRPWRFDDGTELGSYNTQQRWLRLGDRLFLVYTRRGLNNDHIFRNRAPLLLAEVDPQQLCVRRKTERILIPEKGAALAAWLTVAQKNEREAWVCATEDMENGEQWGQVMLEKLRRTLPATEVARLAASTRLSAAVGRFGSNGRIYVVKVKASP